MKKKNGGESKNRNAKGDRSRERCFENSRGVSDCGEGANEDVGAGADVGASADEDVGASADVDVGAGEDADGGVDPGGGAADEPTCDQPVLDGTLYVVATPIGNLSDLSPRIRRVLGEVDLVASEDTRTVGVFLSRLGIKAKQTSLFEGNEVRKSKELVNRLEQGDSVALVCEAGTPGISDPGAELVAAVVDAALRVVPVPGPCAAVTALSASGFSTRRFLFEGFLPKAKGKRKTRLRQLACMDVTLVFYESPRRLARTLEEMAEIFGEERRGVVARELTKLYEEILRDTVGALAKRFHATPPRGEVTLIVEGSKVDKSLTLRELDVLVKEGIEKGEESSSRLAARLAKESGWLRRKVYERVLFVKKSLSD